MKRYRYLDSPLGRILLTADGASLDGLYFVGQKYQAVVRSDWTEDRRCALFAQVEVQLAEYFAGARTRFDLPIAPAGTSFQNSVWRALGTIPCGTTSTYGALAESLGAPRSVRAAAAAVGRNPISIIVPCHRVIGRDGSLTGYAGGLDRKRALLALEAAGAPLLV
jgi:methylated-DNA-[protein]-cysteine S-methyltransferase